MKRVPARERASCCLLELLLVDGAFAKFVERGVGLRKRTLMVDAEDDDRIAPALRVQAVHFANLKKAIGLTQVEPHGKRNREELFARRLSFAFENLVAIGGRKPRRPYGFRLRQTLFLKHPREVVGQRLRAKIVAFDEVFDRR